MSFLKAKYDSEVRGALKESLGLQNVMQVPRVQKVVVNMGVGEATQNPRLIDEAVETLTAITGQKAVATRSRKAISNFKLRENVAIGAKVTLHGQIMWEFLERLLFIALPRVRDFRGISSRGFDGNGNYSMGIKEQTIFPEIDYDKINKVLGMDICVVTSAANDEQGRALLEALGFPFRK
ncbi:MAG: 50S ribosomal protein L5 [Fibrobacterales bacterium]|nr:50S ribosomal protein L5 [Fibrobacterales bacterium]MBP5351988.1 50S ribosomal protein L5 [Fibrobacterales bacterium]